MIRVIAWMSRFIGLCRGQNYTGSFLSHSKLDDALTYAVRISQHHSLNRLHDDLVHQRMPNRVYAGL